MWQTCHDIVGDSKNRNARVRDVHVSNLKPSIDFSILGRIGHEKLRTKYEHGGGDYRTHSFFGESLNTKK